MGKFTLGIVVVYILYYAGNIIYDLYIRKEKIVETDEATEYAMEDVSNQSEEYIQNVIIDDVENIRMPQSFEREENILEEPQNLEGLQKKYEEENEIEQINDEEISQQEIQEEKTSIVDRAIQSTNLINILSEINSRVKVVANYDGQKVYNINN